MIADCETCERRQVPCSACQESQRTICFICQGDEADPYGEQQEREPFKPCAGCYTLAECQKANHCFAQESAVSSTDL